MGSDFAALILTHGRPDGVLTYETLRRDGYTGRIVLLVDDQDKAQTKYVERYGDEVVVFDKAAAARSTDRGDNSGSLATVLFARNASFEVARRLGLKRFVQLDDDYSSFFYRFDERLRYAPKEIRNLDLVFSAMTRFLESSGALAIAFSQGGDFIGGADGSNAECVRPLRKCMNSFFCSVERPFRFMARMNDDVTTYVRLGNEGKLFFTTTQASLNQHQTQSNPGGLTEMYLEAGTYVKSFYSVMYQPSSVVVAALRDRLQPRLHHSVSWRHTVPKILPESLRKS